MAQASDDGPAKSPSCSPVYCLAARRADPYSVNMDTTMYAVL